MSNRNFTDKSKFYSQYRPNYPAKLLWHLQTAHGLNKDSVVADVGAGTGIFTDMVASVAQKVYAVDPNEDMLSRAKEKLVDYDNIIYLSGSAEQTHIPDNSVDLITVAQAFHWFDTVKFKEECRRILKPDGKVAIIANIRDTAEPFYSAHVKMLQENCPTFTGFSGGKGGVFNQQAAEFFIKYFTMWQCENHISYDMDSFVGYQLSTSYAPKPADKNYDGFIAAAGKLFAEYSTDGRLIIPFTTKCFVGIVENIDE